MSKLIGSNPEQIPTCGMLGTMAFQDNVPSNLKYAQNLARATVASHATTADIWGAAGNQIDWTGTATTTAFPNAPQGGATRTLICAGACSFTAGTNMLIDGVASAATVTCAANDKMIVEAVSTTQFRLSRVRYDGTAGLGANTFTGQQTMSGKSIIEANASVAAHATTMNPWQDGNYVTLTGTAVTFTALANAPQAGAEVELYMNAAHVFTDGAVFEVDGNANYTAAIGDRVVLRAKSTTVFTVHPRKADGTATVDAAGAWVYLSTVTASASATVDIETTFNSTYDMYVIVGEGIYCSDNSRGLYALFKQGGTYHTGAADYAYYHHYGNLSAMVALGDGAHTGMDMTPTELSNDTGKTSSFVAYIPLPADGASEKKIFGSAALGVNAFRSVFNGVSFTTTAVTGVRFMATTGNLYGTFRLYGIKNS